MAPDKLAALLALNTYPHLRSVESAIVREWIRAHGAEYEEIAFDVLLGQGVELGPGFDETTRQQATLLFQKRADLIASRAGLVNIVEVKRRIDFGPMGQLIGYATLYRAEFPDTRELRLTAIGWDALQDAQLVLNAHGIDVETFPNLALAHLATGRRT